MEATHQFITHPGWDPVIIHLFGPLQIRWYSLLYVGGFIVGAMLARRLARESRFEITPAQAEEMPMWLLLGAVIGARIIYCFVYDPKALMANPLFLFQVYKGGLAFHGGLLGVMVGGWLFARKHKLRYLNLCDLMAVCTPPGLAMGRLGNFINGELWGRTTTSVPWAMIFPRGGNVPRHPSQVYELLLEGVALFLLLWFLRNRLKKDGQLAIVFLLGYSTARFIVEFFREPDAHIGYLQLGLSMGQWLCIIMFIGGLCWNYYMIKQRAKPVPSKSKSKKKKKKKKRSN